jgi:phytoene/squalene synthetase
VNILNGKEYTYGKHYLPHDVEVKELQTGKTRKQFLESFGFQVDVVEKL